LKRENVNYVQYLASKEALTNSPDFPQAMFGSVLSLEESKVYGKQRMEANRCRWQATNPPVKIRRHPCLDIFFTQTQARQSPRPFVTIPGLPRTASQMQSRPAW
jgi:hypothetical protein